MNFINLTFLYLLPYIYNKNSNFLKGEEVFKKFTIKKDIGKEEVRRRREILFY
jgi:hypothetical protein